jgi:hypothetical protein
MYLFSENGQNVTDVKAIRKSTPLYVKKRKKRLAPSLHGMTSYWLHENSIPNIGCDYFWPGLIALPKNTPPIMKSNYGGVYWALPPQGQGLSHWIQLLEVLPY